MSDCNDYADDACYGMYESWARDNCAKRCNYCKTATAKPHTPGGCWDKLSDCRSYGNSSCLPPYDGWARENCNDTCGFCRKAVGVTTGGHSGTNSGPQGVLTGTGTQIGALSPLGWVTLLKGVHGVPNDDLFRLWASSETRNANNSQAMAPTDDFPGHYKSDLSNYWDICSFDEVKVAIWDNGHEVANVVFDARNSDKMSWFDPSRIITSTYTDIQTASKDLFSLQGDVSKGREFYMSQSSNLCSGTGWFMVSTQSQCFYEGRGTAKPTFYYAPGTSATSWPSRQEGDVFMIAGKGGNCTDPSNPNGSGGKQPVCTYNGQSYNTGQSWQDGCDKNCTCRDANLGYYQCDDLCRQYQLPLPVGCRLETIPGQCCDKLTCDTQSHSGCFYKGQYYGQNKEWDDGCDYHCTCQDASTGFYTCITKCPTWNLPSECYLDTPATGNCCPVPRCPAGYVVQYPPGYSAE